ncbi:site-specific integrase [Mycolicibacterium elephantis]
MAGKPGRRSWGWIRRSGARWHASYIGPDLARHNAPRTFTAKMDAEGWLADERRLVEYGDWTPPAARAAQKQAHATTVTSYAKRWIEHRQVKARTKAGYEATLARHIEPTIGRTPLRHLTSEAVRSWYASLDKDKPTARAHAYQLLHAVMATAVTDGLLVANPCNLPKAMAAPTKKTAVILDLAEVAALADAIKEPRFRLLVLLSAWCAPRWGEVTELRRKDVNDDHSAIHVARAVTHRSGICRIDTPKSGKGRKIVVPPHIRDDLAGHLAEHVAESPDALLFVPVREGCHIDNKSFRDSYLIPALNKIGRDGEIKPRPTIHDLRHFAGTQTARVANLKETMDRLGHSTVKASLIYQQSVDGRDAEVAAALSKLANGDDTPETT